MPVILAGAGCGSPRLLTAAARQSLESADYVVYDRLIHPDLLQLAPAACEFHLAGKRGGDHVLPQEEINRLLVKLGSGGGNVVRLKGGDPFVFGRGGEEAQALEAAGISWTAIPGVTAALGGALMAGLPITHRSVASAATLATGRHACGTGSDEFWRGLASVAGTVALYMGALDFGNIASRLITQGKDPETPVAVVVWGGWGRARRINGTLAALGEMYSEGLPSPAIAYIGPVADIELTPEQGPLSGITAAICRPYPECWATGRALEELGADCYGLPLLALSPLEPPDLASARGKIADADWLVLTSPRGPRELMRVMPDLRAIRGKIAAIGSGTERALREIGLVPEAVGDGSSSGLAQILNDLVKVGERVVFARNEQGSHLAVRAAKERGARTGVVPTYRMTPRSVPGIEVMREQWAACGLDAAVFGSAAMVHAWAEHKPGEPRELIAWGSACAEAVREVFGREAVIMRTPDLPGLIETLRELRARKK